ncbi:MAG: 3-phosphoserine/phosphohydroxythreonine transaminase [Anaerovoracaceae bacterium]|nr:3-phosphoserine/phosphohydroxythreonine transaminase [Anaerovoracaceae bacterium]
MKERVYNFSAGPSMLPIEVLEDAAANLTNYKGCGTSVMEMSHRSKEFQQIIDDAEANLRKLMNIPENYKVLFLQGGGTLQFSMVPMNLMTKNKKADYIITGSWGKKAAKEAAKFGDVKIVASSEDKNFSYIPEIRAEDLRQDADYVHICYNETIHGVHFNKIPDTGDIPLVADMSSCILSEEVDVSRFALIYAGAQKNIAPSGMTIVIIREDLIGNAPENCPVYLDYKTHADKGSMYNTPPCFTIYIAGEVFKHILAMGGVREMHERDVRKAEKLYNYIDSSDFYKAAVSEKDRSLMNVVFVTGDEALDKEFVAAAREEGMTNLNGHRSVGGMRASIYNAMPEEGVDKLIDFMKRFEEEHK